MLDLHHVDIFFETEKDRAAVLADPSFRGRENWELVQAITAQNPKGMTGIDIGRNLEADDGPDGTPAQRMYRDGRVIYSARIEEGRFSKGTLDNPTRLWFDETGKITRAQVFPDQGHTYSLDEKELAALNAARLRAEVEAQFAGAAEQVSARPARIELPAAAARPAPAAPRCPGRLS